MREDLATASHAKKTTMGENALVPLPASAMETMTVQADLAEGVNIEAPTRKRVSPSHFIKGVPWHQQLDGLSCAAGSLETVFHYWGVDIDQREIMNVARTSSSGTSSSEVVRTGQFSMLSDAKGVYSHSSGPFGGFSARRMGYAAFSHTSDECWFEDLKAIVADDIPVIVLMSYEPTGGEGHYRVVIGYDDAQQLIYLIEPWNQDTKHQTQWEGVIAWSYSDFQRAWDYLEQGATQPYYGAVIMPWSLCIAVKGKRAVGAVLTLTAKINYSCPEPFDKSQFPAQGAMAQIKLPKGMTLIRGATELFLGRLNAGDTINVTWDVLCSADPNGMKISVTATGVILGSVPAACWQGRSVSYPAYSYSDMIGGEAIIEL